MRELRQDWRDIFLGFRIALDAKKMFLGLVGVAVTVIILFLSQWVFNVFGLIDTNATKFALLLFSSPKEGWPEAFRIVAQGFEWIDWKEAIFLGVAGLCVLAWWSLIGGAICRIAAIEVAKDERIELTESTKFSSKKFWSYFWSPLVPLLGMAFFAICNNVGGLVCRIPYIGHVFVVLGGLFFPLAALSGFLIVLIAIGGFFGLPLMFPTISSEGTDAFDAISRAYSYVYSKPWRYIWYNLVATAYGVVVSAFVAIFALLMVQAALGTIHFGMGQSFDGIRAILTQTFVGHMSPTPVAFSTLAASHKICAVLLIIWISIIIGLVLGFFASYICTADTIIYFLMRKAVDGTDMTEVYTEEEEEDFGVPPTPPAEETKEEEKKEEEQEVKEEASSAEAEAKEEEKTEEKSSEETKDEGEAEKKK